MEPGLAEALYEQPSAAGFRVVAAEAQRAALTNALRRLADRCFAEIPFPDEPGERPFAKFGSAIEERPNGELGIWFDMPDAQAYRDQQVMERLVVILVEELEHAGIIDCVVRPYNAPGDNDAGEVPQWVLSSFADGLPAGLPSELVTVLCGAAFDVDSAHSISIDDDGWEIHLAVDGDLDEVALAQAAALSAEGFEVRTVARGPYSRLVAFRGFGQRGSVELYLQVPLSVHVNGQFDQPVPLLAPIGAPPGSQPVRVQRLSSPDRVEMAFIFPGSVEATLAFYESHLRSNDFSVAVAAARLGGPSLHELGFNRPDCRGFVVIADVGGVTYGATAVEFDRF